MFFSIPSLRCHHNLLTSRIERLDLLPTVESLGETVLQDDGPLDLYYLNFYQKTFIGNEQGKNCGVIAAFQIEGAQVDTPTIKNEIEHRVIFFGWQHG